MAGSSPAMTNDCAVPVMPNLAAPALSPNLRRGLFARLVDRDVLAMCKRRTAVGDDQRVELDEAVALLFVIAGHLRARGNLIAAAGRSQESHPAADVNPGAQDGVVDQHLVHHPLQQAGMAEPFGYIDRMTLPHIGQILLR